ncbi:pseudouridine synthase [Sphingobacterium gobiense]|uniref:Pseudouridine synthase n=1 Tax=Sphingobacterium gobiense TaxID=1382456 RepID=A0A2S9JR09_9SPHI|nr:pseudouridine synthase [Sphingobacterium gobiense]PRD55732.1 pseudouridylate synthase [Sphingobacterium gobiense]
MPFNNKRNSRDDNSKKSRSNSESFRSKNGRSQRSSSTNEFRKTKFEEEDNKKSNPFSKFEKKNKKDDSGRSFSKSDKLIKRNTDRPFQKDEKGGYSGPKKFEKTGKKSFNRFDDESKDKYKNKESFRPSYPRKKIAVTDPKDDGLIRLNRYISNAGICSRRKADELIESGVVTVNGEVVTELGTKVDPTKDEIRYNGERLKREKMVYVLLNKPKDFITTTDDPQERKTVMQLVAKATKERIYPVGRLDRNTTGLLLLTNDGSLAEKLSHPRNNISKIYHVELSKNLTQGDFNKIEFGLELEDGFIKPDDISFVQGGSRNEIGIQIHSGKNRVVRRIFESLGYEVVKLDRVVYANLTKKDLPRGRWRYLEEKELIQLKHFIK